MHKYRMAFLGGLAAGFVVGARAGRERYEQLKKLARSAAENPAVQQAAGALQAQTAEFAKTAGQKVTDQVRDRVPGVAKFAGQGRKRAANGSDADGSMDSPGNHSLAASDHKPRPTSG